MTPPTTPRRRHPRRGERRPGPSRRSTLGKDLGAGAVLGLVSVPDGLASGLLAGVNPVAGLYGYLFGTLAGAVATSSVLMSVQGTGAMAVLIEDVPQVHAGPGAGAALVTLGVLTGLAMLAAGLLRLGPVSTVRAQRRPDRVHQRGGDQHRPGAALQPHRLPRGGCQPRPSRPGHRAARGLDPLAGGGDRSRHGGAHPRAERTRLGGLGMVVAIVVTSAAVAALGTRGVALVNDVAVIPDALAAAPACRPSGWSRRSSSRPYRWPSSAWSRGRRSASRSPTPTGPTPTSRATSGVRAWGTWSRGSCRGFPSGARCRPPPW